MFNEMTAAACKPVMMINARSIPDALIGKSAAIAQTVTTAFAADSLGGVFFFSQTCGFSALGPSNIIMPHFVVRSD